MPKRSNQFQRLILLINHCIGHDARVTESALVTDSITGEPREVDIVLNLTAYSYPFSIGVEVRGRNRKADTTWIECMHAKHESLPLDKLVLVSESGFTNPALRKAAFYGIEVVTIEDALETDWELVAKLAAKGIFEITSFKYNCALVYELPDGSSAQMDMPGHARFRSAEGEVTLDQFVRSLLDRAEVQEALYSHIKSTSERQYWFSYEEPHGLLEVELDSTKTKVLELRVGIVVEQTETPVMFAHGKYRGVPFLTGTSLEGNQDMQFVLLKTAERITGRLVDNQSGIRTLLLSNDS